MRVRPPHDMCSSLPCVREAQDQQRYPSMAFTSRPSNLGLLTEERYDEYINHVMSLTPKQRKKWHIVVKDERGVGRRMYVDGCFKIKTEHGVILVGGPSSDNRREPG